MTVGVIRRTEGDKNLAQQSILSRAYSREAMQAVVAPHGDEKMPEAQAIHAGGGEALVIAPCELAHV